jgi:muconate cycloisomerase
MSDAPTIASVSSRGVEAAHRAIFEDVFGGRSRSVVVEVTLDDGRHGEGEATLLPAWSGEEPHASLALMERLIAPTIVGEVADIAADKLRAALAQNGFLVWAIEAAIRDALGVGSSRAAVPVRGLVGRLGPEAAAAIAATQVAEGLTRLKVKLEGDLAADTARLRAVHEAAPRAAIVADANESIDRDVLADYGPVLRETSVVGLEQPCPRTVILERGLPQADGWFWVADESIWTVDDALVLRDGPWHAWTLHPGKARGEDATRRIAEIAADRDIACVLGSNIEFGPGAVALHRVAAALPDLPAVRTLGHDHACAVLIDGWKSDVLSYDGGVLAVR